MIDDRVSYEALTSDFCTQCGLIVHVDKFVRVLPDREQVALYADAPAPKWIGILRPLVVCPNSHYEVQP